MPLLVESSGIFDSLPFCSFLRKLFWAHPINQGD